MKRRITQHGMYIALWKGVVYYYKTEIIHFMIDPSNKFAVKKSSICIRGR